MEHGTIIQWMVKPGDRVKRGDIVVEIETEKADMEVEIFEDGVIEQLLVDVGDEVEVGAPLARLTSVAGAVPAAAPAKPPAASPVRAVEPAEPAAPAPPRPVAVERPAPAAAAPTHAKATPGAHLLAERLGIELSGISASGKRGAITRADVERASVGRPAAARPPTGVSPSRRPVTPYARRLAAERGLDLAGIAGTGPGGAIAARDLPGPVAPTAPALKLSEPRPEPSPKTPEDARLAARQRAIAGLMARSKREIPHYYLQLPIDVTATLEWLQRENANRPLARRLLLSALLLRSVALATKEHPEMNGFFVDDEFRPSSEVHLGVAISQRRGGLVAPAILDAHDKPLDDLMAALRNLVERARANKLRAREMSAGTVTVTNLGDTGVESVHGVIFPPQVALVGFGKPLERPWAENGMLAVRTVVTATLAGDHRVSDGHRGGLFLAAIARYLKNPEAL